MVLSQIVTIRDLFPPATAAPAPPQTRMVTREEALRRKRISEGKKKPLTEGNAGANIEAPDRTVMQ